MTPLHYAVINNHISIVAALIKAGADVNARDDGGVTPLFNSELFGHSRITEVLMEAGAR